MRRATIVSGAAGLALLLAACGSSGQVRPRSSPSLAPSPPAASGAAPSSSGAPKISAGPRISKVLTIVEENHGADAALAQMPYLAGLARAFGWATSYSALTHPSLPNYLALAEGSTFGIGDDGSPAEHRVPAPSVFGAAVSHHGSAVTYAEDMPRPCSLESAGRYAVKHNPWAYVAAERAACDTFDVPLGSGTGGPLRQAILDGTLPNVGLVVPNLCDDAHDCSLARADAWLRLWVPLVMQGPDYRAGRLAVVVTFDEGEGDGGGSSHVLTAVVAAGLHARRVSTALSHLSWCRWMTDLVGAPPLRGAAAAVSLGRAFGL